MQQQRESCTLYPPGTFDQKESYKALLKARVKYLRDKRKADSWTGPALDSLEHDLEQSDCWVAVYSIGDKDVAYAFARDRRNAPEKLVYIGELQINEREVSAIEDKARISKIIIHNLQERLPSPCYYAIVHKDAGEKKENYKMLFTAQSTDVWHPDLHPYRNQQHWRGIFVGRIQIQTECACIFLQGAENRDPKKRVGIKHDARLVRQHFQAVPSAYVTVLKGNHPQEKGFSLLQRLTSYHAQGVRRIVVIFSGHAENDGKTEWPEFEFQGEMIELFAVHQHCMTLFDLSIVGADCCNEIKKKLPQKTKVKATDFPTQLDPFGWTGHLIFSSSKKGEVSFGNPYSGSFFLRMFFKRFNGDWLATLKAVQGPVRAKALKQEGEPQTPWWNDTPPPLTSAPRVILGEATDPHDKRKE